jgi:hypothetical protein
MRVLFLVSVVFLLIASANLGLVNSHFGIKASDGGNLLGIRDVLMVAVLAIGLVQVSHPRRAVVQNPLSLLTLLIVVLTPFAMIVGLFHEGPLLAVARDGFMMLGWLLVVVIAANLLNRQSLRVVCTAMLLIGLAVALGVFVEAASAGTIRVVTPRNDVATLGRSTPSGWPMMMLSSSLALVLILTEQKAPVRATAFRLVTWVVVVIASLLTQSRTLLVGIGVSTIAFLFLLLKNSPVRAKWIRLLLLLVGIPVAVSAALILGNQFIRPDFSEAFVSRYSVLRSLDSLVEYSGEDARRAEVAVGFERYVESPWVGVGLGSEYRDFIPGYDELLPRQLIHNVLAFFLYRYGPVGLIAFLLLACRVFVSLDRALRDRKSGLGPLGAGLAVGIINLLVCAFFGNVFATTYGAPQAMAAVGGLVAYEHLRAAQARQPDQRRGANTNTNPLLTRPSEASQSSL